MTQSCALKVPVVSAVTQLGEALLWALTPAGIRRGREGLQASCLLAHEGAVERYTSDHGSSSSIRGDLLSVCFFTGASLLQFKKEKGGKVFFL